MADDLISGRLDAIRERPRSGQLSAAMKAARAQFAKMSTAHEVAAFERDALFSALDVLGAEVALGGAGESRLLAAVEAVLFAHKIEPLFAHADDGECGCPVPADVVDFGHDAAYDAAHPEGYGPGGTGIVCSVKIVGHWCPGCADVAVRHGCFETPKSYPPEKCDVRAAIESALTGTESTDG